MSPQDMHASRYTAPSLTNCVEFDEGCPECDFRLWNPIARSKNSILGLYDDSRFPGRSILRLINHYQHLSDLPHPLLTSFITDIKVAQRAIQEATGATRVNVAILGNRVSHVHVHLIPRFPDKEEYPDCSPWNDTRPKLSLGVENIEKLKANIFHALEPVDKRPRSTSNEQDELYLF